MSAALRRPAAVLACVVVALSATSCGPFPGERARPGILGRALAATASATSVTLHTDVVSMGTPMKGRVSRDDRGNCTATMSYGAAGTVELIRIDGRVVYLRRDEALLRLQERHRGPEELEALVRDLRGRWTNPPVEGPGAPEELALCGTEEDSGEKKWGGENGWDDDSATGEASTVDGQKALRLAKPVDSDGGTTTVYVAAEGPPYLLRVVTTGGDEPGTTTYSRYNRPVEATAPAAEDVVLTD
ncbi:hypothetical protein [Streptomyces sp. NPDC056399]|uniref:hypothetical protein n=1 Tax=Streptomyces sp. NPDC056399 TaxID=3345807 RepID=UPI0035D59BC2